MGELYRQEALGPVFYRQAWNDAAIIISHHSKDKAHDNAIKR